MNGDELIWDAINNEGIRELGKILYEDKIIPNEEIPYERFLKCHLDYLDKYKRAQGDLLSSLNSLISHPETGKAFKTHLLEVRRNT